MNPAVIYFIPGQHQTVNADLLKSVGLDHLIGAEQPARPTPNGPDGLTGIVFQSVESGTERNDGDSICKRDKEQDGVVVERYQVWQSCDGGKFWIGWNIDDPPMPACFLRTNNFISGTHNHFVAEMNDGNSWGFFPALGLPRGFGVRGGEFSEVELEKYRHIYDASERLFEYTVGGEREFDEVVSDLAICLSVNYRVGVWEVLALGLFTKENIQQAIDSALDIADACNYGQKKTTCEDAGQNSG